MKQIERINRMEQWLHVASKAVTEISTAIDKYEDTRKAIEELAEYYYGPEWKKDYADDEAGLLPKDLKRGVLSEDGIWNLLSDWQELEKRLKEIASQASNK